MSRPVVTLTTDFGQADAYVGIMKGVLLGICPDAALVDLSHEIHPQAVRQAAYLLSTAVPYFPPGVVHLVVVDPGVGSERRPVAVQTERATYVAPDNGVLTLALTQDPPRLAVHLTDPRFHLSQVSATFHGRDIFAPAAAHLACGLELCDIGEPFPPPELVVLPTVLPTQQPDGTWQAEILHIDRFGNLITNYQCASSSLQPTVSVGGERIQGLRSTFADVAPGELVAYRGSSGYLEIAIREGSAATHLGLNEGDPIVVEVPA